MPFVYMNRAYVGLESVHLLVLLMIEYTEREEKTKSQMMRSCVCFVLFRNQNVQERCLNWPHFLKRIGLATGDSSVILVSRERERHSRQIKFVSNHLPLIVSNDGCKAPLKKGSSRQCQNRS